jgi:glutamate-5-semialdehyde dehydrogenase
MATTLIPTATTQEKLLRARAASVKLALLSTNEKNALLLAIADAIEAHEKEILAANADDMESSG